MAEKKLYEFGDGILRTHVTWEEIQEKVKELFGEKALFGPKKNATAIGDGRGFMSKMCLIDPDWQEETDAPKKFVLKIPTQITLVEMGEKMKAIKTVTPEEEEMGKQMLVSMTPSVKKLHNTETMTYELIEKHHIDVPHPKIFAYKAFDEEETEKGYLLMEYKEDSLNLNLYDNISVEDVKQALRGIAALEAASLSFTEEEIAKLQRNPIKEFVTSMINDHTCTQIIQQLREFAGHLFPEKIDELEIVTKELLVDMNGDNVMTNMGMNLGMKRKVLVHGDCWSTNFLWKKKEDSEGLELAAMIDYQTCHMGHPGSDLFRLIGASLSGKDRQGHWEELVEYFYSYLMEQLKGAEAAYTLEQLKENYRRYTAMGSFFLVPMIPPLMQLNQMNPDPESKERLQNLVLEKVECLLDDLLKAHKYNLERKEVA